MFAGLGNPQLWLGPLAWQAGTTLGGLAVGLLAGVLLAVVAPSRIAASTARTVLGYLPALGLVLIGAVMWGAGFRDAGRLVQVVLPVGLVALSVFASVWAAHAGGHQLTEAQARAARAMGLNTRELLRTGRPAARRAVLEALPAVWRRALTVTTVFGIVATAAAPAAGIDQYGLGGLIATALRTREYPPALAGAIVLLVLALFVELILRLLHRPVSHLPLERHADATT